MVFKKKWTKRRSASTKEPGFVEGSRLTDFGFTHVKNNFDPAKPRVGENTITFLAKKTGASRATITRAVKMEYTVSSLPSKRMKRAAPKVSKERLKMMNQRREWVMVLVERTATEVRTRFQPKRKKVSSPSRQSSSDSPSAAKGVQLGEIIRQDGQERLAALGVQIRRPGKVSSTDPRRQGLQGHHDDQVHPVRLVQVRLRG
jgi:hypothetical protein